MTPIISVVIAVHNGEKTIKETIESVLSQSFRDFELIVINDGSTDKTMDVVSRFNDPRIRFFSFPNRGVSISRNEGAARSAGEYLSFIDADDIWKSDKLKDQLKALEANPGSAVAYSWSDYMDETGCHVWKGARFTNSGNVYEESLLHNIFQNASNALIKKEAFEAVGGFDPYFAVHEDWDIALRLAEKYSFACVQKVHILYRIRFGSMSTRTADMEKTWLEIVNRNFSKAPKSLQHLRKQSMANLYWHLIFKTLEKNPNPKSSLSLIRFTFLLLYNKPSLVRQKKVMLRIILKIIEGICFPSDWRMLQQSKQK